MAADFSLSKTYPQFAAGRLAGNFNARHCQFLHTLQ